MQRRIEVRSCSITDGGTVCVVNASNEAATLGGGVSKALYNECGGTVLQDEMTTRLEEDLDGVLDEGDCLVTSAGTSSRFRYILHVPAVDYRMRTGRQVSSSERIRRCTVAALEAVADIAGREGTTSVTFPLMGAGAGGLDPAVVCQAMITGMRDFFRSSPDAPIELVLFAVPEPDRFDVCSRLVTSAFG